ncbi:hypothetical protein LK537_27310 [Lachnoclostridium pacaense]|uniref:hypothetical protein n=1 Tax=Enterocloster hominis (ex Hitch et al. 2024) TaxID=1917870 RepID=UPI001D0FEA13|nr:hypothetical protein [Lachnoclostridium pacaense]MCC2821008.1 hypothetical protein [Lachnoclostridium pacaense]
MKTVGVAGCQPHIGTTTQALQLVLCLIEHKYSVAYVEMGDRDYLSKLQEIYEDITADKSKVLYCRNIPMYTGKQIILANQRHYDYTVKDYGCINSPGFETISFLEQDIKVVVGGTKANEIEHVEKILEESCYADVNYIFSFVPLPEQRDIKELMRERKENTYFAVYTPDPFVYQENDIYLYLLGE